MATPYALLHLEETPSTQDVAGERYAGSPLLVVADRQAAGRGRSGNPWYNAERSLAASLAVAPGWDLVHWPRIPLVAGLAARQVLPGTVGLKWPNDLVVGAHKVGGVLVEAGERRVVIGLGVNLWWSDPPAAAGSLLAADPGPTLASTIAQDWAADLLNRLDAPASDWGRGEYRRACVTLGRDVAWDPAGRGRAVDVDEMGRLVVDTDGGRVLLSAGQISHLRP